MDQAIIRADGDYRKKFIRRFIVISLICILILAVFIQRVLPWARGYLEALDYDTAFLVMKITIFVLFLGVLPFAVYLLRLGQRIVESQQLPPPGTKVIRDTKIIRGAKAIMRGRIVIFLSLFMICLSLIGAFYIPYKMDSLVEKQAVNSKSVAFERSSDSFIYQTRVRLKGSDWPDLQGGVNEHLDASFNATSAAPGSN